MPSKLLNFRLDDEKSRQLEELCEREGVTKSVLLRRLVEEALTLRAPLWSPTAPGANDSAGNDGSGRTVDLVVWLSGRANLPKALIRQRLKAGRVRVAGIPYRQERLSTAAFGSVELDGEVY